MELELGEYYRNGRGEVLRITNMGVEMIDGCDCVTFFDQNGFEYVPNGVMVCSDSVEDDLVERVVVVCASDLDDGPCICDDCIDELEAEKVSEDTSSQLSDFIINIAEAVIADLEDAVDKAEGKPEFELEDGEWYWCASYNHDEERQMVYVAVHYDGFLQCVNGDGIAPQDVQIISKIEKPEVE